MESSSIASLTMMQQQSSPLILLTLKRKENEQITLLTNSSIQRLANRIPTHPLLGIRQLNDQTSATWKSLININLPQHSFLKDHKIHNVIFFPVVAYLELVTTACQQLLSSKENDQQPTIIFEDVNFIKALILNEHELVEIFIQIIMPMCQWYIYSRPWSTLGPDCMSCTDVIDSFHNQDNFNKYSLNKFTLHAQDKIEIDSKQQKSLTIPNIWTTQHIPILVPGIETTFLSVRIQKFIYSSKIKTKVNLSTNIEVRGIGQEGTYSFDLWIFSMDNKIEEAIFTFQSIIIQQVQGVKSSQWSMEQTIYDKLNLTTDLPNVDHKTYLNIIVKDYCMKRVWTDSLITKDISQDLIEPVEPFNELAAYYAQMTIKDLDLNQQHHPLLNACHSLASTLHEQVTWHSTQLRLIQLIERFPRLKPFLIALNKYGLHLKDILNGEENGLLIDLYYADFDPIQLANAQQTFNTHINNQTKNLSIIYDETIDLYDSKTLEQIPIESSDIIFSANQLLVNQNLTKKNSLISLRRLLVPNGLLLLLELVQIPLYFHLIFGFIDQW
ncbi:unnamed protein product [Adineta steineri]|uniref:PKS/mFAS DH domain-containing protein n=1 Tax=Adineta steineri TaxID=433720 RepID=A0A819SMC3_9BILA|nr:unnamed protein product [Adineta steineri]